MKGFLFSFFLFCLTLGCEVSEVGVKTLEVGFMAVTAPVGVAVAAPLVAISTARLLVGMGVDGVAYGIMLIVSPEETKIATFETQEEVIDVAKNHPNWEIRREAIRLISDSNILCQIIKEEEVEDVAFVAIERINDQNVLLALLKDVESDVLKLEIAKKLSDEDVAQSIFKHIAKNEDNEEYVRFVAIAYLLSQSALEEMALHNYNSKIRYCAIGKLINNEVIKEVSINDNVQANRSLALKKLNCQEAYKENGVPQEIFFEIVNNAQSETLSILALELITSEDLLADIAKKSLNSNIASLAAKRVTNHVLLEDIIRNSHSDIAQVEAALRIPNKNLAASTLANIAKGGSVLGKYHAIKHLENQPLLEEIAQYDDLSIVRSWAIVKLTNQEVLGEIAKKEKDKTISCLALTLMSEGQHRIDTIKALDESVLLMAINRGVSQSLLVEIAKNTNDSKVRTSAMFNINDQTILLDLVLDEKNELSVRREAMYKLKQPEECLLKIALNDNDNFIATSATAKIKDQTKLALIGKFGKDKLTRQFAIERLTDCFDLLEIVKEEKDEKVRYIAFRKLRQDLDKVKEAHPVYAQSIIKTIAKDEKIGQYYPYYRLEMLRLTSKEDDETFLYFLQDQKDIKLRNLAIEHFSLYHSKAHKECLTRLLMEIAKNDSSPTIRKRIVEQIPMENQSFLTSIAENDGDARVRLMAAVKIDNNEISNRVFREIVLDSTAPEDTRLDALSHLSKEDEFLRDFISSRNDVDSKSEKRVRDRAKDFLKN